MNVGNPEPKRVEENIKWIQNSAVRSLHMSQLSGAPFSPRTLLRNPFILHRLVIQMDEDMSTSPQVLKMLQTYTNLRLLDVSCLASKSKLSLVQVNYYRRSVVGLSKEVLERLVSMANLKEFHLSVDMRSPLGVNVRTFYGTVPEPTEVQLVPYPCGLSVIKISLPVIYDRNDLLLSRLKHLLDTQRELVELEVDVGFPYWTFFSKVVRNNAANLCHLTLVLSNWHIIRTLPNWHAPIPEEFQLNWTTLLPDLQNLKTLKVTMTPRSLRFLEISPSFTHNFNLLQLNSLVKLDLSFVHLREMDFLLIFQGFPNLENVELSYWSGMDVGDYTDISIAAFSPIMNALNLSRFERIRMTDWSVRSCPVVIRDVISNRPNYTTTWPLGHPSHGVIGLMSSMFNYYTTVLITKN